MTFVVESSKMPFQPALPRDDQPTDARPSGSYPEGNTKCLAQIYIAHCMISCFNDLLMN